MAIAFISSSSSGKPAFNDPAKQMTIFHQVTPLTHCSSLQLHLKEFPFASVASFLAALRRAELPFSLSVSYSPAQRSIHDSSSQEVTVTGKTDLVKATSRKTAEGNKWNRLDFVLAGQTLALSRSNLC